MFTNFNAYKENKAKFFSVWGDILLSFLGLTTFETIYLIAYCLIKMPTLSETSEIPIEVTLFSTAAGVVWITLQAIVMHKFKKEEVGLRADKTTIPQYIIGVIVGLILISLSIVPAAVTKTMIFSPVKLKLSSIVSLFILAIGFMVQSFSEEYLCRGLIMKRLSQRYNIWFVVVAQAIIFAVFHLSNTGITLLAFVNLTLIGLLFGLMTIKYDDIIIASAVHFIWNWAQGCLYGISVSGIMKPVSILDCQVVSMDSVWTGGAFGIEGSITVTVLMVVICAWYMPAVLKTIKEKSQPVEAKETITNDC